MASEVDIANLALTILGQEPITDIEDDDIATARAVNSVFGMVRDSELTARWWRFAVKREEMAALVDEPTGEDFDLQYQLPSDFLSLIRLGNGYVGNDSTDYRIGPTTEFSIEGDKLLTNYTAPLLIVYSAKLTETSLFHPCFNEAMAARIAYMIGEKITGSTSKREDAKLHYREAINRAMSANAILNGPQYRADNSWMLARLG